MVKISRDSDVLEPGTAVLLRNRAIGGNKIQDAWSEHEYVVLRRIDPEKHVYEVYRKDTPDDRRIVNRVHLRIKPRTSDTVTQLARNHVDRQNSVTQVCNRVDSDGSSDSSYDDEFLMMNDSVVSVPSLARPRRSTRVTAGKHDR
ncbi:uncharacterized protein LOC130054283 [Ostrea edulis]|uniref:uncharacterized protein LOC130054283 n=1 Tax=Ostrea edulis TaxID=37623 RepID=UPI0024AEA407|nr:uncharacterized protein LOC130054283 [Ostrea edulis]